MDGGSGMTRVGTLSASLGQDNPDALVVDVVIDGTCGIAATAYTSHQHVGIVAAYFFLQLFLNLFGDDALQTSDHVGVGVGTYRTAYNVEGVGRVTAPVTDSLIGSVLQCPVAGLDGAHFGTQHLHTFHVDMLALHVQSTLIHHARHVHQGAHRSGSHAVLTSASLGNDTLLAHFLGQ